MVDFDLLFKLLGCDRENIWSNSLFSLASSQGFDQFFYTINTNKQAPVDSAFVCTNYVPEWLDIYNAENFYDADPIIKHCMNSTLPIIWDRGSFKTRMEKKLYEAAASYGLSQGITYPVHGNNAEFGTLTLIPNASLRDTFQDKLDRKIANWALIRDYIFESSKRFTMITCDEEISAHFTPREIECLGWAAEGKSSWEISTIFKCSEATVNFHFSNIRRKFMVNTRQQAIVKAMRLGLIFPGRLTD